MNAPKPNLISVDEWIKHRFIAGAPSRLTIQRLCRNGRLPATKVGGLWYIDVNAERNHTTGNALVDRVLMG